MKADSCKIGCRGKPKQGRNVWRSSYSRDWFDLRAQLYILRDDTLTAVSICPSQFGSRIPSFLHSPSLTVPMRCCCSIPYEVSVLWPCWGSGERSVGLSKMPPRISSRVPCRSSPPSTAAHLAGHVVAQHHETASAILCRRFITTLHMSQQITLHGRGMVVQRKRPPEYLVGIVIRGCTNQVYE